jgi:hypothetical protein
MHVHTKPLARVPSSSDISTRHLSEKLFMPEPTTASMRRAAGMAGSSLGGKYVGGGRPIGNRGLL